MSRSDAGSRAEADDGSVDDRVKRWQWFFRTRVGLDGESLGGFAKRAVRTSRDAALQAAPPAAPGPHGALNLSLFSGMLVADGQDGFVFPFDAANDFDDSQPSGSETIHVPKAPTWIGRGMHPDVHLLAFALTHNGSAFDGKSVWIGCDGGVFQSIKGGILGSFEARNRGKGPERDR